VCIAIAEFAVPASTCTITACPRPVAIAKPAAMCNRGVLVRAVEHLGVGFSRLFPARHLLDQRAWSVPKVGEQILDADVVSGLRGNSGRSS